MVKETTRELADKIIEELNNDVDNLLARIEEKLRAHSEKERVAFKSRKEAMLKWLSV